jgi:HEAT repeat protein
MASAFSWIDRFGPAGVVAEAILLTVAGIALLLAFILLRRGWRSRVFRRRDRRVVEIRAQWDSIICGDIPAAQWRDDPLSCEIVEMILLDSLETATPTESALLLHCLRLSGLLDLRILDARRCRGWRRRHALASLGRMRASEAIPALAEALDDRNRSYVLTAIRGLGRLGLPEAAVPLLDRLIAGQLSSFPTLPLQNALLSCCRPRPQVLLPYIQRADEKVRPLLMRVLGEVASGDLEDELVELASDPQAEVRASTARALATAPLGIALSTLTALAHDDEWFVRLRAVVSLGDLEHPLAIPALVDGLCDRNRFVRLRAASGLSRLDANLEEVLDLVVEKADRYALQALLSELQCSGVVPAHLDRLVSDVPMIRERSERLLVRMLELGAHRLLVSALGAHRERRVRFSIARLLARSRVEALVPMLERASASEISDRRRKVLAWVIARLQRQPSDQRRRKARRRPTVA